MKKTMYQQTTKGDWEVGLTRTGNLKIHVGLKQICSDNGFNPRNAGDSIPLSEREANFLTMSKGPKLLWALESALELMNVLVCDRDSLTKEQVEDFISKYEEIVNEAKGR